MQQQVFVRQIEWIIQREGLGGDELKLPGCFMRAINGYATVRLNDISIDLYPDNSGPTVRRFVGDPENPEHIRIWDRNWIVNPRLKKEPEVSHLYKGSDEKNRFCRYGHSVPERGVFASYSSRFVTPNMARYIIPNSDLGREYTGDRVELTSDVLTEIMGKVNKYFEDSRVSSEDDK